MRTRRILIVDFSCLSNVPHKHVLLKAIRYPQRNQDSVVGVVTRPRVILSAFGKEEGANVSLFSKIMHINHGVTQTSIQCVPGFFTGVKWGVELHIRLHLEPKIRKCAAITPYSTYDSMQWTGTIFKTYTYNITLTDIPNETFCVFPSVSTGQYLQDSIHINHCLLRIYERFSSK